MALNITTSERVDSEDEMLRHVLDRDPLADPSQTW